MAQANHRSLALFSHLGSSVGELRKALRGFDHPALHRGFEWEVSKGVETVNRYLHMINGEFRPVVEECVSHFREEVAPRLPNLEHGIIHGDLNDYNVLVGEDGALLQRHQWVSGFIDFGDAVYSPVVGDLAIAAAYAVLDVADPLATIAALVRGYCEDSTLTEEEAQALFGIVRLRLCISAAMAAYQQQLYPENEYLGN